MDTFEIITGFAGAAGYAAVLGALLLCGLGVPVPEDIVLLSGGYIASEASHPVMPMMLVGLVGIVAGDSIIFGMGRSKGIELAERTFLRRYLTPERLARVDVLFRRHGEKILVAARFLPGLRAVTFFTAGAIKVPYWKFLVLDGLAALVSAPVWVYLGYAYGHTVLAEAKKWQGYILAGLAVLIVAALVYRRWKRSRQPGGNLPAPPPAA